MKRILAFGASNNKQSINKQFATFAAQQIKDATVHLIDLNDYEMPIYSIHREEESGIPKEALDFKSEIKEADGIVISFAEYNSSYTSAFKNIYDWISRVEKVVWAEKPMLLLATSPGLRGAKTVLQAAFDRFSIENPNLKTSFSLPHFNQNFNTEEGILDPALKTAFQKALSAFNNQLSV